MPPRFATQGRFDILGMEDAGTSSESEDEVIQPKVEEKVAPPPVVSRKNSGKKKANANAVQLAETAQSAAGETKATVEKKAEEVSQKVEESPSASELAPALGSTIQNAVDSVSATVKEVSAQASEQINSVVEPAMARMEEAVTIPSTPTPKPKKGKKAKSQARAENETASLPSTTFSPELPESLPVPSSPSARPQTPDNERFNSNHKRPAPSEFNLDTKGVLTPPAKGVKFEDGLSPGQGKEGETVIPGIGRYTAEELKMVEQKVAERAKAVVQAVEAKKNSNVFERTIWTLIMIGGFITLLLLGPPYMILLVFVCQCLVYKEITALFDLSFKNDPSEKTTTEAGDQWSKTLNWYFFVVANYFLYGESIIYYFKHIVFVDAYFLPFAQNHRFISFMLYVFGFMAFVMNLQKQYLRRQFGLFCWVHMTLLLIVVSSHFIVNNILEGMIWFFVPASLVICNDIFAYICGKTFGKTPLFKLSPKKTVEGFVGAFFCTLIFAVVWGTFFMRFPYMICPAQDLGVSAWSDIKCSPNPTFLWRSFEWPGFVQAGVESLIGRTIPSIPYAPFQIHCLIMAAFGSLVAPFGGFFASGFKRAFDIKDFGDSIPGHGGMTDRMDCQFIMGIFSAVYYSSLIRVHHVTVGSVLQTIVNSLSTQEQLEVLYDLQKYLHGQGVKVVASGVGSGTVGA